MPSITIKNLTYRYKKRGKTAAIDGLSCSFVDGVFNVIVGPSGCGKTTLLKLISSLLEPYEGSILTNSVEIRKLSIKERRIAFVSQEYVLYPHLTVFDNIAFPLKAITADREEIIRRVYEVANELNLVDCLPRKPRYLSGGQKQRVALARAIVKNADLILFDEPLSNIDPAARNAQRSLIKKVIQNRGKTAIYVTHDFKEALLLADYLYVMDKGKIVVSGKPLEVFDSGVEIVNDFKRAAYLDHEEQ